MIRNIFFRLCVLITIIFLSPKTYCQYFDSLIFKTHGIFWPESVIYMGDQNNDGFDDFMVSKMDSNSGSSLAKSYFYYGGSPIPDTPAFFINIFKPLSITACDVNRDGYRDIINHRGVIDTYPVSYNVYLGGPNIDTIPDFVIYHPDSNHISILYGRDWPIDFDGDGWEEFVTFSYSYHFFIFKTTTAIQPEEYGIIKPDSAYSTYEFYWDNPWFADLDGDGMSDISVRLTQTSPYITNRRYYYGNPEFEFTNYYQFSSSTVFAPEALQSVRDMNGDGKGELIIYINEGGSGAHGLSFGSRPPDLVPELRLSANGLEGVSLSPGDVNGDGYEDLLRSIPYSYYALYLGGQTITGLIAQLYRSFTFNCAINFAGHVGDVNGDGIDDICVGENAGYGPTVSVPPGDLYIYAGTRTPSSVEEEGLEKTGEKNIEVAISPNPTNGKVNIHFTLPDSGMLSSEIFDILGRRIYNNSIQEEKGAQTKELNIQNFAGTSGIYIFHFTLKTGEKTLTKSVKVQLIK